MCECLVTFFPGADGSSFHFRALDTSIKDIGMLTTHVQVDEHTIGISTPSQFAEQIQKSFLT